MLLFRMYRLTTIIYNILNNFSIKQGEVSTFPVGTRRTHTNSTHSREYYIQWMSRRRKSNVMHLPSLQPSSCSLLTSWYLSRPTIRRALIITTYYVNNQWYWLWPEGLLRRRVRDLHVARRKRARHEAVLSSCPSLASPTHQWRHRSIVEQLVSAEWTHCWHTGRLCRSRFECHLSLLSRQQLSLPDCNGGRVN